MENGDYEGAIQSFERARTQLRPDTSQALSLISLVSFLTAILQHIEWTAMFDRYLDGDLMILTS